jgi:hypothetical protein
MSDFRKGDIVVVVGIKSTVDGDKQDQQRLARVLEVGRDDIFALDCNQSSFSRGSFKIPKIRCVKVVLPAIGSKKNVMTPMIGDLVLSLTENYTSSQLQKKSGVLKEISDIPWQAKRATLLIGTKQEEVPYESLMVLER